jgi:hypothetical protein
VSVAPPDISTLYQHPSRPEGLDPVNARADNDGEVEQFVFQEVITLRELARKAANKC